MIEFLSLPPEGGVKRGIKGLEDGKEIKVGKKRKQIWGKYISWQYQIIKTD